MKPNILASAALLVGAMTASCSAPQRATPEDRAQCSMAIDYFSSVIEDVERVVYGEIIIEPMKMKSDLRRRVLDATSALRRDCANIPEGDVEIEQQAAAVMARIQRMKVYFEQQERAAPKKFL